MASDRPNVAAWLRDRTPKHLELLSKMQDALAKQFAEEHLDQPEPDRAWCRVYNLYQQGYHFLLTEERERAKLQLMAKRAGMASLTDEEYLREMTELGREAVKELSDEEFASEARRRGLMALGDGVS